MNYGWHMDEALFPSQPAMRSDVSCTVFLSDPADFDGGELMITLGRCMLPIKLRRRRCRALSGHNHSPGSAGYARRALGRNHLDAELHPGWAITAELLQQVEEARNIEMARGTQADTRMMLMLGSLRNNMFRLWSDA